MADNIPKKLIKFESPKNEQGEMYYIPVVAKNRDYLLGFLACYEVLSMIWDIPMSEITRTISSDRFNDILADDSHVQNLSKKELKDKIRGWMDQQNKDKDHIENNEDIYRQSILTCDCGGCGMFYDFKNEEEIPENDMTCSTCGRNIIHYTNHDDSDFEITGDKVIIEEVVEELQKEIEDENKKNDKDEEG